MNKAKKITVISKTRFDMSITDLGGGELEGIITDPEVIVHGDNRPTLIRKSERQLREKHSVHHPEIKTKLPTGKPGNRY